MIKRKYAVFILIIVALGAGIFIYLQTRKLKDFEPQIIARLQSLVRNGSDSLYRLSIEGIDVDVVNSRIAIVGASLEVDSAVLTKMDSAKLAPNDIFRISLDSLHVGGLNPVDLLDIKSIHLDALNIDNPSIEIFHKKRTYNANKAADSSSLYQKLSGQVSTISVDTLTIKNAGLIHHNLSKGDRKSELKDVSIAFTKILIDSTTEYDTTRFLFAKQAVISLKDYSYRTSDGLYFLKSDAISISAPANAMKISGFALQPAISRTAFDKAAGFRKEQYDIAVGEINIDRINWWDILNEEALTAGAVTISDGSVKVYLNRALPASPKSKVGNYPHQLLMKAKIPVQIRQIKVSNLDVSYEEFNPGSGKSGTVYFDNTTGTISNITNQPEGIVKDQFMRVSAHALFMHGAQLQCNFVFDLAHYREGKFQVDMQLTKIDKDQLEDISNRLGMFSINSGNIQMLKAHVDGTDMLGKGNVLLLYDDLKIIPLKKDDSKEGGLSQRNFQGFIINSFILKDENPSGKDKPRNPTGEFVRETDKSFFNLVWKTILVGILKTVGAKPSLAKSK